MKIEYVKRLICFILCFCFLFSLCSVNSFASTSVTYNTIDFSYSFSFYSVNGSAVTDDISCEVKTTVFDDKLCTAYIFPDEISPGVYRCVTAFDLADLNSSHEYGLTFDFSTVILQYSSMSVYIDYVDVSGKVISSQELLNYSKGSLPSGWNTYSFRFVPEPPSSGYSSAQLTFHFENGSAHGMGFYLSPTVELIDYDGSDFSLDALDTRLAVIWDELCNIEGALNNISSELNSFHLDMNNRFDNLLSRFDIKLSDFLSVIQNEFTNLKNNLNTNFSSLISSLNTQFSNLISNLNSGFSVTNSNIISFQNDFNTLIDNLQNSLNAEFEYINNFLEENFNYESGSDDMLGEGQTAVDDLNNGASEADEAVPSINESDLNSALNQEGVTFFISDLTNSFMFFEMLYESVISSLNIEALILFCLSFGIAIYIIGRRLGVG